jgi:Ion channel
MNPAVINSLTITLTPCNAPRRQRFALDDHERIGMLSAFLMFRRVANAFRYAVREQDFLNVFGAGALLVFIGTLVYSLDESWNVVDSLYFAVSTLTTTSVADPNLVLTDRCVKIFTVLYQPIGIGILVEILRRLGAGFVAAEASSSDDAPAAG